MGAVFSTATLSNMLLSRSAARLVSKGHTMSPTRNTIMDDFIRPLNHATHTPPSSPLASRNNLSDPRLRVSSPLTERASNHSPMSFLPLESIYEVTRSPVQQIRKEPAPLEQQIRFHEVPASQPARPEDTIRVVSYNILAETLALRHGALYGHTDPAQLTWKARLPQLLGQLQDTQADFFCLQEVDNFPQLQQSLGSLGYKGDFKKRTSEKNTDGCAIFWNSARFSHLESHPIEFNHGRSSREDFDNVAMCSLFSLRSQPSRVICVVSTHFLFNPQRGDLKMGQAQYLLSAIEDVIEEARLKYPQTSDISMVVAGDMNSTPYSGVWELFRRGELSLDLADLPDWCSSIGGQRIPRRRGQPNKDVELGDSTESLAKLDVETDSDTVTFSHDFDFGSAYENYGEIHEKVHRDRMNHPEQPLFPNTKMSEPLVTSVTNGSKNAVDSIWFTKNSMRIHRLLDLPNQNDVMGTNVCLPSIKHPSDHFLLGADFVLRENSR